MGPACSRCSKYWSFEGHSFQPVTPQSESRGPEETCPLPVQWKTPLSMIGVQENGANWVLNPDLVSPLSFHPSLLPCRQTLAPSASCVLSRHHQEGSSLPGCLSQCLPTCRPLTCQVAIDRGWPPRGCLGGHCVESFTNAHNAVCRRLAGFLFLVMHTAPLSSPLSQS